ncbi:hypothetical protein D1872_195300 [compost metagenome]|nr:hypothetical protein AMI01nite_36410 [Aneurinibacillus migulanus]
MLYPYSKGKKVYPVSVKMCILNKLISIFLVYLDYSYKKYPTDETAMYSKAQIKSTRMPYASVLLIAPLLRRFLSSWSLPKKDYILANCNPFLGTLQKN